MSGLGEGRLRWYVLRSKPRKESALQRYARQNGHEVYCPSIPTRPVNPRAARVAPYFPGYLFLHADLGTVGAGTFHWMPYSAGLVEVGGEPGIVPDLLVRQIAARVAQVWRDGGLAVGGLKHGDPVMFREGAFEGYRAIFDMRLPGSERARVLLRMLNDQYVPLEVDLSSIERETSSNLRG